MLIDAPWIGSADDCCAGQLPQLHAWWHMLVALALHEAFVVGAVIAILERDGHAPTIRIRCGLGFIVPSRKEA